MKNRTSNIHRVVSTFSIGLALLVGGCGNSAQQKAYEQAAKAEQQLTAENASAIIAEYKQVIALQPGSEWARKAQARIEALEARLKAEELRKSVFQEHGID
jgi:outer membrane protein assembly factor BamD (BamD/ComL family)